VVQIVTENDQMGTMKDEFLVALREFQADCGGPSFRTLALISQTLKALYLPPVDPVCELHGLSPATMSEVLSGKRLGPPSFDWVASFVLSCQRFAVRDRPGRRDQGTTILAHWAAIYAAHVGEWSAVATASAAQASGGCTAAAYRVPADQEEFVSSHGPHGQVLLARARRGHPHARYCVALLLASDPVRIEEAAWLLIEVAGTGHALALDLLDARRDGVTVDGLGVDGVGVGGVIEDAGIGSPGADPLSSSALGDLSPYAAAQHAYELACKAWDRGADDAAYTFCRAAARGGVPQATLGLAQSLLAGIDPEAATWLGSLGTERAVGRHRSDKG
jgi:hypothetical protein